jgi:hypothetical protein
MNFTASEAGWYVLDPNAEGGARKAELGELDAVLLTNGGQAVTFDSESFRVEWRG